MFQSSVLRSYLARQERQSAAKLDSLYAKFRDYFGNEEIQNTIRNSKESSLQGEFLERLFGGILGYISKPDKNYNLEREVKSETNAKEADGAILVDGKVRAVIELKGMKTTDLDKIDDQAFGYHSEHRDSRYIITSNYQKLRFYINKKSNKAEFDLFSLSRESFALLYLCLSWESIKNDLPLKILGESVTHEATVTKKLYDDYSAFKAALWGNLCAKNRLYDKLTLFQKTQKLLDRILFMLFAEDTGLLDSNTIEKIVSRWEELKEDDEYRPLYDQFKKYFGYINTGNTKWNVFAYNGGLFQPDEILDAVQIDDSLLAKHTRLLAQNDFASEVDVNILGHIFEHSLTEIEEITAQLTSDAPAAQSSKRKKDGIFYTPKYITEYIVEQTLGKLCKAKRAEMKINAIDAEPPKKAADKKELHARLDAYRAWLLNLKICDPACGSGAFLNQALEFLIAEHQTIAELYKYVEYGKTKSVLNLDNIETEILENNLYGVDINEEAVEIAKLSLWLRTAQSKRKLNELSHRIKLGNSLISDTAVAGEKAFCWQTEFPEVFSGNAAVSAAPCGRDARVPGGFDVMIGNPPYVSTKGISAQDKESFVAAFGFADDLYHHFVVQGLLLTRAGGVVSMITPDTYFTTLTKARLRKTLLENTVCALVHLGHDVFESAMVSTAIFVVQKKPFATESFTVLNVRGKKDFADADVFTFSQKEYEHSINGSFFVPNAVNEKIHRRIARIHSDLIANYWDKISTSRDIANNEAVLGEYRSKLTAGDWTLVGLVTEGGQGLATANNGKYVGVKSGSKEAARILETRVKKLAEVNARYKTNYALPAKEQQLWELFEKIKQEHGRDVFGQGYLYRIVPDAMLADVDSLTDPQKLNGIDDGCAFVPYDKGDKDGNRWYLETPFLIDWSVENVYSLKNDPKARFQGHTFYFRTGFCWNNNLNENYDAIKCRIKQGGVPDVAAMSLYSLTDIAPDFYLIFLINSQLCGRIYRRFLNATVNVQMNDIKALPIRIPTESQLAECKQTFDKAVAIQQDFSQEKLAATSAT